MSALASRLVQSPLYWRSTAQLPTGWTARLPHRGANPPAALRRWGIQALPARQPTRFHTITTTALRRAAGCGSCRNCGRTERVHELLGNHRTVSTTFHSPSLSYEEERSRVQGHPHFRPQAHSRDPCICAEDGVGKPGDRTRAASTQVQQGPPEGGHTTVNPAEAGHYEQRRNQFSEGISIASMTSTSTGSRLRSSLSPSCSCTAVKTDGRVGSAFATDTVPLKSNSSSDS